MQTSGHDNGSQAAWRCPRSITPALGTVGAVVFWLGIWQLASMAIDSPFVLASPLDTLHALVRLVPSAAFWGQVGFSAVRIAGGAATGCAVALALAAASAQLRFVHTLLAPALSAIKGTPVACVVVMLLIWFGSRNVSAIAVFLMVLPGIYFPALTALDTLDPAMRELMDVHRVGMLRRLLVHVWPGMLPYLTAASSTVLSMSWKAGVAAELIGVPTGSIGERIYQAKLLLETADLFAWTIVVMLVAWAFEHVVLAALRATWPAAGHLAARLSTRKSGSTGYPERTPAATFPRNETARPAAPSDKPANELATHDSIGFSTENTCVPKACAPTLSARQLVVGYPDGAATSSLDFQLGAGGTLCVQGASGAGKTTLLRTLATSLPPLSGQLSMPASIRIAAMFQNTRLVDDLTALENVALFAPGVDRERLRNLLAELLPIEALSVPVRTLSGGQRRRVELARALAAPADLILLDEPFTGLDTATHTRALAFIQAHRERRILILATHDPADASALGASILSI